MSTETAAREADETLVREWLARPRFYPERAPDPVWEAHLRLQGDVACEHDECRVCYVFCDVCGVHYDREDVCRYH